MPLSTLNLASLTNKITQPFVVMTVAVVGRVSVNVYISQGEVNWHKHPDEDELFLVHEGAIELETERGAVTLLAEELSLVPKGLAHRSSSALRSIVVIIRTLVTTKRQNGHHHPTLADELPAQEKVRLARVHATQPLPYQPVTVARIEAMNLLLVKAQGFSPAQIAPEQGAWWLVLRGALGIEVNAGAGVRLDVGDLTTIPAGTRYHLSAAQPTLALTLAQAE